MSVIRKKFFGLASPRTTTSPHLDLEPSVTGYNSARIAKVVVAKNHHLISTMSAKDFPSLDLVLLRPLFLHTLIQSKEINVVDLGGGGGTHYHVFRKFAPAEMLIKWAVVETDEMVKECQSLVNPELRFFTTLDQAKSHVEKVDVALASGSFPYMENPIKALRSFLELGAEFLFITRTALSNNEKTIYRNQKSRLKDNGPGDLPLEFQDAEVEYPLTVVSREEFLKVIQEDYEILCEIQEEKGAHKCNSELIDQYGYLCKRK